MSKRWHLSFNRQTETSLNPTNSSTISESAIKYNEIAIILGPVTHCQYVMLFYNFKSKTVNTSVINVFSSSSFVGSNIHVELSAMLAHRRNSQTVSDLTFETDLGMIRLHKNAQWKMCENIDQLSPLRANSTGSQTAHCAGLVSSPSQRRKLTDGYR